MESGLSPERYIGVVQDDARLHRRPLYPPADRSLIWNAEEVQTLERYSFRPLILSYMAPRFLFDFHSAGGLLGHLRFGLVRDSASKWLHDWEAIDVRYVDGRMDYTIRDPQFPDTSIALSATPLAGSAGLAVELTVTGGEGCTLVWAYGGASAYSTNWNVTAPEFNFTPEHCAKDEFSLSAGVFTLRRPFDENDVYMGEVYAAARYLKNWAASVQAGSDWGGKTGFGAPHAFTEPPATLLDSSSWIESTASRTGQVAVECVALTGSEATFHVVAGMGGDIAAATKNPESAMAAALARNATIGSRVTIETPDPYLNAAARMMAYSTEGIWGDTSILDGAWSWRFAYLGWRGWYGPLAYGWTERVRRSIENHTSLGLVREGPDAGALGSLLEYNPGVYYNMNEVFLAQVQHYFEYTDDLALMRDIFPVLRGILAWEDRRLRPGANSSTKTA